MKIGYIFIILLLLVACKPYDDYKERGHWKQLKENERIGFYWRHNDKIYAALGDSANHVYYPWHMIAVDADTFGYEYATELIVRGAFPSSFRYIGDGKGTDGYTMYRYGWRVDK